MEHTNLVSRHTITSLAAWLLCASCITGCATNLEPTRLDDVSGVRDISAKASIHGTLDLNPAQRETPSAAQESDIFGFDARDEGPSLDLTMDPLTVSATAGLDTASCYGSIVSMSVTNHNCGRSGIAQIQEPFRGNEVPLRPPLRQLWFQHPRLVPLGDDIEFNIPHSETLAHRARVTSGSFRNPYTGLRDQPLLHRDTSRAPITDSTLPEIGPPPPKHTIKTFGTLTVLSLVGIGVYAWAPSSFTGADDENQWEEAWAHFKRAWTKPPVFDGDGVAVNYLGHPYFGMNFYLSQRNYGESPLYSFLFSTFTSTCFEYFIESWSERPSATDLIITPIVGSILGELVYRATQGMRKDGFTTGEKIILTVINPLYVLQNGYR